MEQGESFLRLKGFSITISKAKSNTDRHVMRTKDLILAKWDISLLSVYMEKIFQTRRHIWPSR